MATSVKSPRQLIIGVDAMEWSLVQAWAAEGTLPTLARLMRDGTRAELASIADRLPDQAWSCMLAGANSAHFARYFYVQHDPLTGGVKYMPDSSPGPKYLWEHLSDAGLRAGVIDAPHAPETPLTNGYQLVWGVHAVQGPRFAYPPSMLTDVDRRFGRHPVGECDGATTARAKAALHPRLLAGIRAHGELFRHHAAHSDWDALLIAFGESHCAGHIYWHDLDRSHPHHDANAARDPIEDVYRAIDREIGTIIEAAEAAGPDVRVYIVSAHGMGPLYHASWNLQEMLDAWGYGARAPHALARREGKLNPWRILRMMVPGTVQYAIYNALPERMRQELVFRFYSGSRAWDRCRAFAIPNNDSVGAIRINLKGRDPHGIVEPREYPSICDDLSAALIELKDSASGRQVVKKITRPHRELRGPYADGLPDLTAQWDASFPWSSIDSPRFGTLRVREQDLRTGSHTAHGFLVARGDGIARGAALDGASIFDLVPTVLDTAGVTIPAACEGRPLFARAANIDLERTKACQ